MFFIHIGLLNYFMLTHLNLYLSLVLPLFNIHSQLLVNLHLFYHWLLSWLLSVRLVEQTLNLTDGSIVQLQMEVVIGFGTVDTLYISELVVEIDRL